MTVLNNSDARKIQMALWTHLKDSDVSAVIELDNRTEASDGVTDFVVIKTNGYVLNKAGHGRCVVLVDMYAKDLDQKGTINLDKLTDMFDLLDGCLPYNTAPYTFSIKNQVGKRDTLGYHITSVNLDCLIY